MAQDVIQEYVVKLGTQIDNDGVNRLLSFFDSSKLKALGVTAAIAGLTTAIYKLVETATKREFELEKLAKQQSKTVALVRAENTALRAMGKTIEEINRDEHLKKIYKDIVEFNKSIAFPNISDSLRKIEGLEVAFYKLKSAVSTTIRWINAQVLKNLEEPIDRITKKLETAAVWIRDNMGRVSAKIGLFISDFSKGIIALGEGVGKVFEFVSKLPDGVKAVTIAIGALYAIIKSGPLGQLITAITLIGDIIHDYENYRYNIENDLHLGEEGYVGNLNDYWGIWEKFDESGFSGIGELFLNKLAEGLENIPAEDLGETVGNFVVHAFESFEALLNGGQSGGVVGALVAVGQTLAKKFFEFLSSAFNTISDAEVFESVGNIVTTIFQKLSDGIVKILHFIIGEKDEVTGKYKDGLVQYGLKMFKGIIRAISEGVKSIGDSDLGTSVGEFINTLFTSIANFLSNTTLPLADLLISASGVAQGILNTIIKGFTALTETDESGKTGIQKFVESIFQFLSNSVDDLWAKIQSGELDLEEVFGTVGETIGVIITSAIKIATDFLSDFVTDALTWIYDPDNQAKLRDIGLEILRGIMSGFGGLADAIMEAVFGDEYKQMKKDLLGDNSETSYVETEDGNVEMKNAAGDTVEVSNSMAGLLKSIGAQYQHEAGMYGVIFTEGGVTLPGMEAFREEQSRMASTGNGIMQADIGVNKFTNLLNNAVTNEDEREIQYLSAWWEDFYGRYQNRNPGEGGKYRSELLNFGKEYSGVPDDYEFQPIKVPIKTEGEKTAVEEGHKKAQEYADGLTVSYPSEIEAPTDGPGKAWGGRISSEGHFTVGEDGPEYIIPITKPQRAMQLINQMLGEMGLGLLSGMQNDMGLGMASTVGGSLDSILGSMGGVYNISAPVNIYVTSNGSDAKEIGTAAYDAAERHLLKTLRGVGV